RAGAIAATTTADPELPVARAAAPARAIPAPAESSGNLATARERIRQLRQAAVAPAVASPQPTETSTVAIPLQVIPPPAETLSLVSPTATPVSGAIPAAASTPAGPGPATSEPALSLLRVPQGNIPLGRGSGGSGATVTPAPARGALAGALTPPPPPPSYAATLGLVYRVFVPAADGATQARVRTLVPDAFRVTVNGQRMMQVGAYADQASADAQAAALREEGFEVQVEYTP
ncbi:MAG TPA: hypothetical protein IGR64_07495, partial [Leptolyngbyaceae cyanobacterium M65_K2018_010]|nr:hypothetical protein [Leptolyngbyaceae cyanobacterium M65_K2018_010]